ncbi:YfjI family protein [Oceaniglobus ichthyenteri]|uniref:YfjI family protein n=1 Tax=Oceaniglobus ichthyenteri TaxID=2136177 RepID=UPI000D35FF51|nr:YfjI family protein [Oceaniglobus ichthyenteri]
MKILKSIPFDTEGPQPLVREIPAGEVYPVEALGPLRAAVEAVQGSTQAPIAIPAASALAAASLAVQGFADVETLGGFVPVSLYFLTIARSGERKSSSDKPLLQGLREYEREQSENYDVASKSWAKDSELYDARKKSALRDAVSANRDKRTAAEADLAALGDPPEAPKLPDRTASEPTLEGLFRAFQQGQPSLGLFSDEAAQFLGGHAMNADNRMKTLGGLNRLWDGSEIQRTRAGDGVYTLRERRLAMHLMAQPVAIYGFLSDPLTSGLGFLPRSLICEPESSIGQRLFANMRRDDASLDAFAQRLKAILSNAMPTLDDGRTLKPARLTLTSDARAQLVEFSDEIERMQLPGGTLSHITGAASKIAEQAARMAGVLTLWTDLEAREVEATTMADAITLARFYLSEASRLASAATVSAEIDRAETLRKWLLENWPHPDITLRDVVRLGPNPLRESPKARAALALLERHGWLVALAPGTVIRGAARKEAWQIVQGARQI